jgi:hypothetical protein
LSVRAGPTVQTLGVAVELQFEVVQLPMVVPDRLAGGRLVLMSARAVGHPWRLSWTSVDLPAHGLLMSELIDAQGNRHEVVAYEASRDDTGEAGGWWEFETSPATDGPLTLRVWFDEPPWPESESAG